MSEKGQEELREQTIQGYPEEDIETGERIMESPITGNRYRVTKWVDKGEGKAVAIEKELVEDV